MKMPFIRIVGKNAVPRPTHSLLLLLALIGLITGCNFGINAPTPTVEGIAEENPMPNIEESASPSPTITITLTLSPVHTPTAEFVALESPMPSGPTLPPTVTPSPSPTVGPWEHIVQEGEVLVGILQQYNPYYDIGVFPAIEEINPGINLDNLRVGQRILIPRPTETRTPQGFEETAVAYETLGIRPPQAIPDNAEIGCYIVQEGDSIIGIAEDYNTTLEVLKELNIGNIFFPATCDFSIRSGGPDCNVLINIGDCVNVPFPTPTPTLSQTPSGNETLTPTPTYAPPRLISPPNGAIVLGTITLEWVSVGVLAPDEVYIIQIYDMATPDVEPYRGLSRSNSFRLPTELIPPTGTERTLTWTVAVGQRNPQGTSYAIVGGLSPRQQFNLRGG